MKTEFMASMMSADFGNLEEEVRALDSGGIDSFHIDIMDGRYVPNYAMSLNDLKCIRSATSRHLDVHLMIEYPNNNIDMFIRNLHPGDTIYIHPEAEYHPSSTLQKVIDAGIIPGIAINPGTSVESVMMILQIVKKVLVMTVNPGNASQMFLPYVGEKFRRLLSLREKMSFEVYWDGACSLDKIQEYAPLEVKGFVIGSTLLFKKGADRHCYKDVLDGLRQVHR